MPFSKTEQGGVHSTAPDASVVFYPFDVENTKDHAVKGKNSHVFMKTTPITITEDLIQVSTSKGKGGVGTFSIILASNQAYKGKLNPGSWCMIYISTSPIDHSDTSSVSSGLKMIGIVRSIRRQEMVAPGGQRMVRYIVSGEDFQSVFNTPVYLNAQLTGDGNSPVAFTIAADAAGQKLKGGSLRADYVLTTLIDVLLGPLNTSIKDNKRVLVTDHPGIAGGRGKPYLVPSELTSSLLGKAPSGNFFTSMVSFFMQSNLLGECIPIPEIGGVTPVWGLLQGFANRILNEIYCDLLPVTRNGKIRLTPSFVLRAIPFSGKVALHKSCIPFLSALDSDKKPQRHKKGHKITVPVKHGNGTNFYISRKIMEHEILGMNSGKSDAERFNFFFVVPSVITGTALAEGSMVGKAIQSKGGIQNLVDQVSLQRYGLRPYVTYSQYFLENKSVANIDLMNQIVDDIWRNASVYENGSVTIAGTQEHIPVGTNIEWYERGWIAHVEKVDHEYVVQPDGVKSFHTSISFVRLQHKDGGPLELTESLKGIHDGATETGQQGPWDRGVNRGGNE